MKIEQIKIRGIDEMMKKNFAFVIGAALLLFAGSFASAVFQATGPGSTGMSSPAGEILYGQLDDPSGSAGSDQSFEGSYAAYDAWGGDDFVVADSAGWDISGVNTPGSNTVAGVDPFFVNQAFYADGGGQPGAVLDGCDFPANTDFTSDGAGNLSTNVTCHAAAGPVWLSQTVRQDFNPFGQHFWATRATAANQPAVWKNPGNGFGFGCLDWAPANAACGVTGEDYSFELLGEIPEPNGTPAVGPLGVAVMIFALGGGSAYVLRRRRA
jgi:hypothetical protein